MESAVYLQARRWCIARNMGAVGGVYLAVFWFGFGFVWFGFGVYLAVFCRPLYRGNILSIKRTLKIKQMPNKHQKVF